MAQCLVPRPMRQLYARDPEDRTISAHHSMYIFPSPPSAPPSPGQWSSSSVYSSPGAPTLSSDTFHNLDQWEWSEESLIDDIGDQCPASPCTVISPRRPRLEDQMALTLRPHPLQDYLSRPSLQRLHRISTNISISPVSPRSFHTLSSSSSSDMLVRTPAHLVSPIPHGRTHIPFLSFILSFLPVDDSTVYLLTHTSPHSALFPSDEIMSDPYLMASERQGTASTEASRLLLEFDEESSAYARLKEGHAVACDYNSTLFSLDLSFGHLWGFVRGFVKILRKGPR